MGHHIEIKKGLKVSVGDSGIGKSVVFIHDWPISQKMHGYEGEDFLQKRQPFITFFLRDSEKSVFSWPGYDYDCMADYVREFIDNLELEDVALSGFSMGSAISMHYMIRHQGHKVSELMLCGLTTPIVSQQSGYLHGTKIEQVDKSIETAHKNLPGMLADYGKIFFENEVDKEFVEWFHQFGIETFSGVKMKSVETLQCKGLHENLEQIHVPTVILHRKKVKAARLSLQKH